MPEAVRQGSAPRPPRDRGGRHNPSLISAIHYLARLRHASGPSRRACKSRLRYSGGFWYPKKKSACHLRLLMSTISRLACHPHPHQPYLNTTLPHQTHMHTRLIIASNCIKTLLMPKPYQARFLQSLSWNSVPKPASTTSFPHTPLSYTRLAIPMLCELPEPGTVPQPCHTVLRTHPVSASFSSP